MTEFPPLPLAVSDTVPPVERTALLLDLDGTLLDIAATPETVQVPSSLRATLLTLRARLDEALAIVTGRPLAQVDVLLPDVATAIAGEHGAALRHAIGGPVERARLPSMPAVWLERAARLAASHPGARLEPKERGFVLHYRGAPEAGPALQAALAPMIAADPGFSLQPALMAWEVRPVGVDKGTAVAALMARPPFVGRLPVFIGDDRTDEDGMRAARSLGGAGLRVADAFGTAAGVRAWLARAAR